MSKITPTVGSGTGGSGGGSSTGAAGGVLSGVYPDPGFAVAMATQEELDAVDAAKAPLESPTFTGTATAPRIVTTPVVLTATGGTIVPDATLSCVFRHDATSDVMLVDPTGGVDGQIVFVEVFASGVDRTVSFPGGSPEAVVIPAGQVWSAELHYRSADDGGNGAWMLRSALAGAAGSSGSGGADMYAIVDAANPPFPLTPLTGNGSNEQPALVALLSYVKNAYGSGVVVAPAGRTIRCTSGITIPAKVRLERATLSFPTLTSGTAVTVADSDFTSLADVEIIGPSGANTTVGLNVSGSGLRFDMVGIRSFSKGLRLTNNNTYIINFNGGGIGSCALCIDADYLAGSTQNSGERIAFSKMTFYNSPKVARITSNQASVFFDGCSMDYCSSYVEGNNASVFFSQCHIETNIGATPNGYLFNPWDNARWSFSNCKFILGAGAGGGIPHIINPAAGPANFGNGRIVWSTCDAFTSSADGLSGGTHTSEDMVFIAAGQTSTTFSSPFATKWGPATALPAWNDNGGYPTGSEVPRIVVAKNGSNNITSSVTVSVTTAPTAILPVRVIF